MKYDLKTVIILMSLFLISQIVGLGLIYKDMKVEVIEGKREVLHSETVLGPRPSLYGWETFVWIISGISISTGLVLLIVWLKKINWWKLLFFTSIFFAVSLALGTLLNPLLAFTLAFILALVKVLRPNIIVHNITEILMYAGIAILLVPLFDVLWVIILLLVISLYDIYAVFKSKHMVKMAKFQMKSRVFAGILIPFKKIKRGRKKQVVDAIIGGGDVAFPLIFSGVVMEGLVKSVQLTKEIAFLKTLIIPVFVTLTLLFLLFKGREGKFYPAMPFITAGCLISYVVILLI
ncbi:MAG: presenilin family intramembrane aspartyl protease [Candidatus Aenigmarchaeota archaeon]|nr:presenilin family intramembrane aspartyl protease [Candidatus Aenigmarchaeota archaeon]